MRNIITLFIGIVLLTGCKDNKQPQPATQPVASIGAVESAFAEFEKSLNSSIQIFLVKGGQIPKTATGDQVIQALEGKQVQGFTLPSGYKGVTVKKPAVSVVITWDPVEGKVTVR